MSHAEAAGSKVTPACRMPGTWQTWLASLTPPNNSTGRSPPTPQRAARPQHLNNSPGRKAPTNEQFNRAARPPNTIRIMDSRTHYKNMLLALLLILAGLAGAIAPQQAAAKDYGIQIGGKEVTSGN